MADLTYLYADITKSSKLDDGSLMVYGKAAGPDLDDEAQGFDPKWLASAVPEWMRWGNVREQHSKISAGIAKTLEVDGDDYMVSVHVVDEGTVKKLEADVLKGFSFAVQNARLVMNDPEFPAGRVVGGRITELSIVDRPANPNCTLTIAKAFGGSDELVPDDALIKTLEPSTMDIRTQISEIMAAEPADLAKSLMSRVELEKSIDADVTDPATQVALLKAAQSAISLLIAGEAGEYAAGDEDDTDGIQVLLDALSALRCFQWGESFEDDAEMPSPVADSGDDTTPDLLDLTQLESAIGSKVEELLTKSLAELAELNAVEPVTVTVAELVKSLGNDDEGTLAQVASLRTVLGIDSDLAAVQTETTKALGSSEERVTALEGRLAKVENTAIPGGPVAIRPSVEKSFSASPHTQLAAEYRAKAEGVTDPELKKGYLALAHQVEVGLTA
jgi:hypothetical protein